MQEKNFKRAVLIETVLETINSEGICEASFVDEVSTASDEYYKNLSMELLELMESFETRAQAADTLGAIIQLIEISAFRREHRASETPRN